MPTFESRTKEFINEVWCHFINHCTTLELSAPLHAPLHPPITNMKSFIDESATTLLTTLEALSQELSIHGLIDEENNLSWGHTIVHLMEPIQESKDEESSATDDTDDASTPSSYTDDDDDTSSTGSNASTITDLRQELYDAPIHSALLAAFPFASRLAEHDLRHITTQLHAHFETLVKDGL